MIIIYSIHFDHLIRLMVVQTAHRTLSPSPTLPVYQFWNSHISMLPLRY
jgi:hypothetical protein